MAVVTLADLLEAGVHFGHQSQRWNPKMFPYIYTERNGIHSVDLIILKKEVIPLMKLCMFKCFII